MFGFGTVACIAGLTLVGLSGLCVVASPVGVAGFIAAGVGVFVMLGLAAIAMLKLRDTAKSSKDKAKAGATVASVG